MLFGKVKHFFEGFGSSTLLFFFNLFCFLGDVSFSLFLALLEFFHTAKSVNVLHFAGEEWVTLVADLNPYFGNGCPCCKCITADTDYFGVVKVLRMYARFHALGILSNIGYNFN